MTIDSRPVESSPYTAKVFVSYSRRDRDFVDRLGEALRARGYSPSIDRADIVPFEDWWARLQSLIAAADTIVFVLSPDAALSSACMDEVDYAHSLNKRIAPIVCRPVAQATVPAILSRLQFIQFDDEARFETSADQLAEALATDIEWIRKHTEICALAERWVDNRQSRSMLLGKYDLGQAMRWLGSRPPNAPLPTAAARDFIQASRRALDRQQRLIFGGMAAALVLSLGLAAWAYWERVVAQRNFAAVQTTADEVIIKLARNLRTQKGVSQELTMIVLPSVEAVMDKLGADSKDEEFQLTKANLYYEMSRTYWFVLDTDNSLFYMFKTLATLKNLSTSGGNTTKSRKYFGVYYDSLMHIGDIYNVTGRAEDALSSFQEALEIGNQMLGVLGSNDSDGLAKVSYTHGRIGDLFRSAGRFDDAKEEYSLSLAMQREFLATHPKDPKWLGVLSWSMNRLGDNALHVTNHEGFMTIADDRRPLFRNSDPGREAMEAYRESVRIRRELVAANTTDAEMTSNLVWSLTLYGMSLIAVDPNKALVVLGEAEDQIAQLLASDPNNYQHLRYRALAHGFRGDTLLTLGRDVEAFSEYDSALELRRRLQEADSKNPRSQRDLFYTLARMYKLSIIGQRSRQSESFYSDAINVGTNASLSFPADIVLKKAVDQLAQGHG